MNGLYTILLLVLSNIFMTLAWYGHLNLVLQYRYDDTTELKRFRIDLSRDGIKSIEEVG